jgi:glucokinase
MRLRPSTEPLSEPGQLDFVVGLDFGGSKIHVATADLHGGLLQQAVLETRAKRGAEQAVERAMLAARELIGRSLRGRCVAAGVACPGVITPDSITLAPNLPGWESLALADRIRLGLDISPVVVANDVKAAAAAEARWGSLQGADPGLFVSLGTGVGAAVLVDGRVLTGAHGSAGEIGYMVCGTDIGSDTHAGTGRVQLEDIVGGQSLGEQGRSRLEGIQSAGDLFRSSDRQARHLVDGALAILATAVANLTLLIDPERIAVGGGLMRSGSRIIHALNMEIRRVVPFPPDVVTAHFLTDSALHGAILLALQAAAASDGRLLDDKPGFKQC